MLKAFQKNKNGNVAMLFALSVIPVCGMVGLALDYGRAVNTKERLQAAVDAAALSLAAASSEATDAQLAAQASNFVQAAYKSLGPQVLSPINVTRNGSELTVETETTMPTVIMQLFGRSELQIAAKATTTFGKRKIEFVMALDNTGSMGWNQFNQSHVNGVPVYNNNKNLDLGSKMWALKDASAVVISELTNAANANVEIRLGLVPFDTQVKVPVSNANADWIKYSTPGVPGAISQGAWTGCLLDRDQTNGNDTKDVAPDGSDLTRAPAVQCATASLAMIEPLTTTFSTISNRIATMRPSGLTNVTMAAVWGASMLSTNEPFTQGATGSNIEKNLLILTDGDNTGSRHTSNVAAMNAKTLAACQDAKSRGISVYTIRLLNGDANMLRNCASVGPNGPQYYDVQDFSELTSVLREIAQQVSQVRLKG
jgi:Flp pilus assembly protein TadG